MGEGSKGGKVIGHTRSGKPIYENRDSGGNITHKGKFSTYSGHSMDDPNHYSYFTMSDHKNAAELHRGMERKYSKNKTKAARDLKDHHNSMALSHENRLRSMLESKEKGQLHPDWDK